jgi:hypothetical protein
MVTLCDDEAENRGCGVTSHGARHIGNGQGVQRRDSHYQQSHLCGRNMTPARTANNARCSRLRGFKVPAVVIDAPLSAHGCVRHANKLPDARGAGTHAASRGLVRSCRPRNRCRPSRCTPTPGRFHRGHGVSGQMSRNWGRLLVPPCRAAICIFLPVEGHSWFRCLHACCQPQP